MTQPVTTPGSSELVPMLDELSGLASQIVRCLQAMPQSDPSGNRASVSALLPVAFSNAKNCLSILQFLADQTPISPPPPSPFVPLAIHSPVPVPSESEFDHSVSPAEPLCGQWSVIEGRVDSLVVDPRSFPSRPTTPATRRWPIHPLPRIRTTSTPPAYPTPGVGPDREPSPPTPLLSSVTPIRHGVSIAELVDEEDSSPGTRGGISSFRSAARYTNVSPAHFNPPLSIHIIDVTPHPIRRETPELPGISQIDPLGSSPSQRSLVSPASSDQSRHTASEGRKTPPCRHKRKGASLSTPDLPKGRVTRSTTKRKAADDSGMGTELSKRVKTSSS